MLDPFRWVWFRSAAYRYAKAHARLRLGIKRTAANPWIGLIVFAIGLSAILAGWCGLRSGPGLTGAAFCSGEPHFTRDLLRIISDPWVLLGIGLLYPLLRAFAVQYVRRHRIRILPVQNLLTEGPLRDQADGFAEATLAHFRAILEAQRPARASSGGDSGPVDAWLKSLGEGVEPQAEVAGFELNVGFARIPLLALGNLLARLAGRSTLRLTVQQLDQTLVVRAVLRRTLGASDWRIERSIASGSEVGIGRAIIDELACRMVATLYARDTDRWQAIKHFTDGMSAFERGRDRSPDPKVALRAAEDSFVRALAEDPSFSRCHYNLGLVYRELGEHEAAGAAFARATREACDADYFYAQALSKWHLSQLDAIVAVHDQACSKGIDDPRLLHLRSLVHSRRNEPHVEQREGAAALAWRALCRAIREQGRATAEDRQVARSTLRDLAIAHARRGRHGRAYRLFEHALAIMPEDSATRFELAKVQFDGRVDATCALARIDERRLQQQDLVPFWLLRWATVKDGGEDAVADELAAALWLTWQGRPTTWLDITRPRLTVARRARLEQLVDTVENLKAALATDAVPKLGLRPTWLVRLFLAENALASLQGEVADWRHWWKLRRRMAWGAEALKERNLLPGSVAQLEHASAGSSLAIMNKPQGFAPVPRRSLGQDAVKRAQLALHHRPDQPDLHIAAAMAYLTQSDFDAAERELDLATELQPAAENVEYAAQIILARVETLTAPDERHALLVSAEQLAQRAVDKYRARTRPLNDHDMAGLGRSHICLARAHQFKRAFDKAETHFRLAHNCGHEPLTCLLEIANLHLLAGTPWKARPVIDELDWEIGTPPPDGRNERLSQAYIEALKIIIDDIIKIELTGDALPDEEPLVRLLAAIDQGEDEGEKNTVRAWSFYRRAKAAAVQGDWHHAIGAYREACNVRADFTVLRLGLVKALIARGRPEDRALALRHADYAKRLDVSGQFEDELNRLIALVREKTAEEARRSPLIH